MKIDVQELLKAVGNEKHVEFSEKVTYSEDDLNIVSPVKIDVDLLNTGETILLTGSVSAEVRLNCVRCLKDFTYPINIEIEEQYAKKRHIAGKKAKEIELSEDDFIFDIGNDEMIDLSEAVRQNLIIALPIKPLCDIKCEGLRR